MNNEPLNDTGLEDVSLVVRKRGKSYYIRGVEDLSMSRRELTIFLTQNGSKVEEIGLMFTYFMLDKANEAHFGVLGEFLFATQYKERAG